MFCVVFEQVAFDVLVHSRNRCRVAASTSRPVIVRIRPDYRVEHILVFVLHEQVLPSLHICKLRHHFEVFFVDAEDLALAVT